MGGALAGSWVSITVQGGLQHSDGKFYFQELSRAYFWEAQARLGVGVGAGPAHRAGSASSFALPRCILGGRSQAVPGERGQGSAHSLSLAVSIHTVHSL